MNEAQFCDCCLMRSIAVAGVSCPTPSVFTPEDKPKASAAVPVAKVIVSVAPIAIVSITNCEYVASQVTSASVVKPSAVLIAVAASVKLVTAERFKDAAVNTSPSTVIDSEPVIALSWVMVRPASDWPRNHAGVAAVAAYCPKNSVPGLREELLKPLKYRPANRASTESLPKYSATSSRDEACHKLEDGTRSFCERKIAFRESGLPPAPTTAGFTVTICDTGIAFAI